MKISVCIPCYEMKGRGVEMLSFSFKKFLGQTMPFDDFEIIVSDDSANDDIKKLCREWEEKLPVNYYKNQTEKGLSSNLNNAIRKAQGEIIKVLCQDDFLLDDYSLYDTYFAFDYDSGWLVTSYYHTDIERERYYKLQNPTWNDKIYLTNTIGTHSCLSFLNENRVWFDTKLSWYMDCDFYYQLFLAYGLPNARYSPTVVQCLWEGQATNTIITNELIKKETEYLINKYENNTRKV